MRMGNHAAPPIMPWCHYAPPPASLTARVECVGQGVFDTTISDQTHIFKLAECRGDILFLRRQSPPAWTKLLLVGAHDIYAADPLAGAESFVLMWFLPWAMGWAAGIPAERIFNTICDLAVVWGSPGVRLAERVHAARDDEQVQDILIETFAQHQSQIIIPDDLPSLIDWIERNAHWADVSDVCSQYGIGERQLLRVFKQHVGLSPKQAIRIYRIRLAISRLTSMAKPHWGEVAIDCGYADQSHLIRDFQYYTGISPRQFQEREHLRLALTHEILLVPRGSPWSERIEDPQHRMGAQPYPA
jgi:AraC-like DNA-binding protein